MAAREERCQVSDCSAGIKEITKSRRPVEKGQQLAAAAAIMARWANAEKERNLISKMDATTTYSQLLSHFQCVLSLHCVDPFSF